MAEMKVVSWAVDLVSMKAVSMADAMVGDSVAMWVASMADM